MVDALMLVAASAGSLIFGVLAAYGLLRAGFSLMGQQRRAMELKVGDLTAN